MLEVNGYAAEQRAAEAVATAGAHTVQLQRKVQLQRASRLMTRLVLQVYWQQQQHTFALQKLR